MSQFRDPHIHKHPRNARLRVLPSHSGAAGRLTVGPRASREQGSGGAEDRRHLAAPERASVRPAAPEGSPPLASASAPAAGPRDAGRTTRDTYLPLRRYTINERGGGPAPGKVRGPGRRPRGPAADGGRWARGRGGRPAGTRRRGRGGGLRGFPAGTRTSSGGPSLQQRQPRTMSGFV